MNKDFYLRPHQDQINTVLKGCLSTYFFESLRHDSMNQLHSSNVKIKFFE